MNRICGYLLAASLGLQFGCAPMYQREGVEITELRFPDAVGGVGREGDGSYWIRIDGNGYASREQAIYYWHKVAIERCGRKKYKTTLDSGVREVMDFGYLGGTFVASRHNFPHAEGKAECLSSAESSGKSYRSVSLKITRAKYLNDEDKYEAVKSGIEKNVITRIQDGIQKINLIPDNGDLELEIMIKRLTYTGGFARANFGVMAGRAVLETDITIRDSTTKEILWPNDLIAGSREYFSSNLDSTQSQLKALSFRIATILDVVL